MIPNFRKRWIAASALLMCGAFSGLSDEGMWLYNRVPEKALSERYGFQSDVGWLGHLQKSSVRLSGASAEFVSPEGLLLSNHHVGSGAIQRLSTPEKDFIKNGFQARTRAEELRCPGMEARVLLSIEDVTARVAGAVTPEMNDQQAFEARRAAVARIEKAASRESLIGSVVTLFQGAEYHLYVYKQYTDVRLVFAPEDQIASFGGDADNFEYPRYCLDICFFRVYEDGKPARTENFLKWSKSGVKEGDLIFVSGHPGRTDRLRSVAELAYLRDIEFPRTLNRLKRTEVALNAFSKRSAENARRANDDLGSAENSRKARDWTLEGLLDPALMGRKIAAEEQLRDKARELPGGEETIRAWDRIAQAQRAIAERSLEYEILETGTGFTSPLFTHARRLVRAAEEESKPDEDRLEEYRSSSLTSLELSLFAQAPIYNDLEIVKLTESLRHFAVSLGPDSELVKNVLNGKAPRVRASELVRGTKLASSRERKKIYEAGFKAIRDSEDPMIQVAMMVDKEARRVREVIEVNKEAIQQAQSLIGKARYTVLGPNNYPDATGTLRLSFGTVKGYEEDGSRIAPWTTLGGLYERAVGHKQKPPFDLTSLWISKRKKVDKTVPFNFVCTADIIGGNSGSPVVNRAGELVGVIFDSNLQGLFADIEYSEEQARAVAVDARGIIEALKEVYGAKTLVNELLGTGGR